MGKGDKKQSAKLDIATPNKENDIYGENFEAVLGGIDREISFYRKRAGQIYFFGFLVEGLFLVGEQKLVFPENLSIFSVLVNSLVYIAIGYIGIYLGKEYRRRIHILKDSRVGLLKSFGYINVYPLAKDKPRSEIQTLYWLLGVISFAGLLITLLPLLF